MEQAEAQNREIIAARKVDEGDGLRGDRDE